MSTGLLSQLGVSVETVYGTYVVPTKFIEFDSESLSRQPQTLTPMGLRAGRRIPNITRHKQTVRSAGGGLTFKAPAQGLGILLDMLHGNVTTPVQQAATIAYLQTHNIGTTAPDTKSRTIQVGKPQVAGTVKPFSYLGSKITEMTFSCDVGGEVMCSATIDAQDETTASTLATATYAANNRPFTFEQGLVTIAAATPALFRSFSLTVPIPQATDRFGLSRTALKRKPLNNDYIRPTLSLTAEYEDDVLYNHFVNDSEVAVEVGFEGPIIAATHKETLKFTASGCKITGATPPVNGPGILEISTPAEIFDTGTGFPLVITYMSTDTTI